MLYNESQSTSNTATNTHVTEELSLLMSMVNQNDDILTGTQITEFERKDRMCTKVIDDTTLRIYFPKASNADPFTPNKFTTNVSLAENINIQG